MFVCSFVCLFQGLFASNFQDCCNKKRNDRVEFVFLGTHTKLKRRDMCSFTVVVNVKFKIIINTFYQTRIGCGADVHNQHIKNK